MFSLRRELRRTTESGQVSRVAKPFLEILEDRLAPAAVNLTWTGATSADWTTAANWIDPNGAVASCAGRAWQQLGCVGHV